MEIHADAGSVYADCDIFSEVWEWVAEQILECPDCDEANSKQTNKQQREN